MRIAAKIGMPIDPEDPASPTVTEVIINKTEDSWMTVVIVHASDGKWYADFDDARKVVVANSAQELAARLWRNGKCNVWLAEAMFRVGWLTLDTANLKLADAIGWRQADPLGHSSLPVPAKVPTAGSDLFAPQT